MKKAKYILMAFGFFVIAFVIYLSIDGFSIFRDPFTVINEQHHAVKEEEVNNKLSVEALHDDMDFLIKTIEDVGVNPYLNISKEEFYKEFNRIKSGIDHPLTQKEFYRRIVPLVHLLKDSHTSFMWNDFQAYYSKHGGKYFPIAVTLTIEGKIYVDHDYSPYGLTKGTEIISINGVRSADILNKMLTFEKGVTLYPRIQKTQDKFYWRLWEVFDFEGPFNVQLNNQNLLMQGITQNEIDRWTPEVKEGEQNIGYRQIAPGVGMLTIKTFLMDPGDFSNQMKTYFTDIKKDSIKHLIVDIRNNGGGSEINGGILIDYIWDKPFRMSSQFMRKKSDQWVSFYWKTYKWWIRPFLSFEFISSMNDEAKVMFGSFTKTPVGKVAIIEMPETQPTQNPVRFQGKAYVLMNHNVFSGAVGFVGAVKDYHIAKLIGEEAGENTNGFGELHPFDLPHSHLIAHASTTFMLRPSGNPLMTKGELPDYLISQKPEDTDKGIDTILQYVIEMINSEINPGGRKNKTTMTDSSVKER